MKQTQRQATNAARQRRDSSDNGSLTDYSVGIIRDRILDLTIMPGQRVNEKLLMERFGLSRTPAREAVNRLVTEGLIDIRRNQGAFVHTLDLAHIRQFFEAYVAIERLVGHLVHTAKPGLVDELQQLQAAYDASQDERDYLLITRNNAAFHECLAKATGNEYITQFASRLYNMGRRISFYIFKYEEDREKDFVRHAQMVNKDHDEIIRTVAAQENDRLIAVLTAHALLFRDRIMQAFMTLRTVDFDANGNAVASEEKKIVRG